MAATEEFFDICDEWGRPLGWTKARALVHRDGDWHRSFHCWLLSRGDSPEPPILLQRRALDKDTWPGLWDVSAAGHYSAGEGIEGGLRELREEMGLDVSEQELVPAARRREQVRHESGLVDREVQDVFFLSRRVDLRDLRPNDEVMAVAVITGETLLRLTNGTLADIAVSGGTVDDGALNLTRVQLSASAVVPRPDGYYGRVVAFARRLVRGDLPMGEPGWW